MERTPLAALRLLAEAVARREVVRDLLGRLRGRIQPGGWRDAGGG